MGSIKGDARSLDYSSYALSAQACNVESIEFKSQLGGSRVI